jgi:hypothetical protein
MKKMNQVKKNQVKKNKVKKMNTSIPTKDESNDVGAKEILCL